MKNYLIALIAACPVVAAAAQTRPATDYIDPMIGTRSMGHVFPGACVPHGIVQLSPDTEMVPHNIDGKYQPEAYRYCAGYQYDDPTIVGFSHTHLSGTGHSDLGDILLMPTVGEIRTERGTAEHPETGYRSRFSHERERAAAGYYEVMLDDYGIRAQLTATERVGLHKYTYPAGEDQHLILDLDHGIYNYEGKTRWAQVRVENDTLVTGYRITSGWARTNYTYFAMSFSKPVREYGARDRRPLDYGGGWRKFDTERNFPEIGGCGIVMHFDFGDDSAPLEVKVALECFETFSFCKNEMELPTVCGLSNISFGLPERSYVNTAFLTMAIGNGLTMAIANPSQELLMNAAFASDMLLNKEESGIRYIGRMNYLSEKHEGMEHVWVPVGTAKGAAVKGTAAGQAGNAGGAKDSGNANEARSAVFTAVLKGNKNHILDEVKHALDTGEKPDDIINGHLIPAINEVGELFDKQKYFLPQLISSANTMKVAIEYLEPMLARSDKEPKATLVVATVEGDIHDIGKNLVVLMLKNYGYHVIDLGKDVPADLIVDTAMKENARVIGLSALMTTTMMRMKDVVELVKERGCTAKVVIGGAAITESFAEEIGADGYSKDAAECVKLVDRLLEEE